MSLIMHSTQFCEMISSILSRNKHKFVDPAASCNLILCTYPNMASYFLSHHEKCNMASTEFAVSI